MGPSIGMNYWRKTHQELVVAHTSAGLTPKLSKIITEHRAADVRVWFRQYFGIHAGVSQFNSVLKRLVVFLFELPFVLFVASSKIASKQNSETNYSIMLRPEEKPRNKEYQKLLMWTD